MDGSSYGRSGEATALQSDPLNLGCSAGMEDRYSLSDRQIYGAEDDFEIDMILAAIERALEAARKAATSVQSVRARRALTTRT